MRLLYITTAGELGWTEDLIGDRIPSYAILSHTWKEGQEVTFDDIKSHGKITKADANVKEGYQKIFFCARQAERDGLRYFWVDTCCIDKTNNTELSEAINSMFCWYQNAEKCYVYLPDVEHNTLGGDGGSAFRESRWFTRGWTLQELLAPKSVEFFSKQGFGLGSRESLRDVIHNITGIPVNALLGGQLSDFSVAERFSWAGNRQTMREEDSAYSLLGIFDIHLPLIYGEGRKKALKRLQKAIQDDVDAPSAGFVKNTKELRRAQAERLNKVCKQLSAPDPSTNHHKARKQRQDNTGLWLLESDKFRSWKGDAASILWLYGIPGCGKTILSSTIIETLSEHCSDNTDMVTVYFYFDFNNTQKQDPELMVCTLLQQLLQRLAMVNRSIGEFFSSCENGSRPPLHTLLEVTQQAMQEFSYVYIVIDALDECTKRSELLDILETIAGWQFQNVHLLMTSRKERDIETSLEGYVGDAMCLQSDIVDTDIRKYIQQRMSEDKSLNKWSKNAKIKKDIEVALVRRACGMYFHRPKTKKIRN
jgi:hypothetical protein